MTVGTLPEQIANHLRREILRGNLAPGAPVKERDNAAELGVSRTPMREAIRILAQEGLVVLRPSRSPIVAQPTAKEVVDNIDVLTSLEMLSGELACEKATVEDIDRVEEVQNRLETQADTLDAIDLFELDMEFHVSIVAAADNPVLLDTHRALLARMWRARFLGSRRGRNQSRVFSQHRTIIKGLRARDIDLVKSEIGGHLGILKGQILQYFESLPEEETQTAASKSETEELGQANES